MNGIIKTIHDIDRCQMRYKAGYMEGLGLKGFHAGYITEICEEPGISQDQLAKRLYADKSNIARQAAFLEENGYVRRENDSADKRILRLYPTERALSLLPEILKKQTEWDSFVTSELTEDDIYAVSEILKKIKCRADAFGKTEG